MFLAASNRHDLYGIHEKLIWNQSFGSDIRMIGEYFLIIY